MWRDVIIDLDAGTLDLREAIGLLLENGPREDIVRDVIARRVIEGERF